MLQATQITLANQLLDYIDTRSPAMADDLYRQPIEECICRALAAREHERLFRALPRNRTACYG